MRDDCVKGHRAYIFDRGGEVKIDEVLDISFIEWGRIRDGISEARVVITGEACDTNVLLIEKIRTHRHELVIFRGEDRVWEGPLHRITSRPGEVEIVAKDVLTYLHATPMTRAWDNRYNSEAGVTEVTTRIGDIIAWELTHSREQTVAGGGTVTVPAWELLDQPINVLPHLQIHHWPNEARTTAYTLPYEMTVGEHLASLGRTSGIDYTAVGRAIHIWDVSRSLGRLEPMTSADFYADVIVSEYGSDHTQAAYVVGQEGVYGQALNQENLDYYGPWTTIYTAYAEEGADAPTQAELNSQAQRNLSGRSPAPVEVRVPDNSGVVLTDLLTINHLVAGAQVLLRATMNARNIDQMQKIDSVTVREDANGETVQVTLTPATRPDSDEEGE